MKYVCVSCEDGGCILEIGVKANIKPFQCPWEDKEINWEELNESEDALLTHHSSRDAHSGGCKTCGLLSGHLIGCPDNDANYTHPA